MQSCKGTKSVYYRDGSPGNGRFCCASIATVNRIHNHSQVGISGSGSYSSKGGGNNKKPPTRTRTSQSQWQWCPPRKKTQRPLKQRHLQRSHLQRQHESCHQYGGSGLFSPTRGRHDDDVREFCYGRQRWRGSTSGVAFAPQSTFTPYFSGKSIRPSPRLFDPTRFDKAGTSLARGTGFHYQPASA